MSAEKTQAMAPELMHAESVETAEALQHDARLERDAQGREQARRSTRAFTLILFCVVIVLLLAVMALGVNAYRAIAASGEAARAERQLTSLIATNVHMMDQQDCIGVGEGPQGDALVITERVGDAAYETRFYLYDGQIVQEYAIAEHPYNPAAAQPLARTDSFEVEVSGQLVTVTTDFGRSCVALRSMQGGER